MLKVTDFTMKDVRCFKGEQSIKIRPITLLVGENSAGKSTTLGCYHALIQWINGNPIDFNIAPYQMGSFTDIVRKEKNEIKEFMLSMRNSHHINTSDEKINLRELNAVPTIYKYMDTPSIGGSMTIIDTKNNKHERTEEFITHDKKNNFVVQCNKGLNNRSNSFSILGQIDSERNNGNPNAIALVKFMERIETEDLEKDPIFSFYNPSMTVLENIINISPIRSQSQRTYDPLSNSENPEGGDVPTFIMQLMRKNKEEWEALRHELVDFGKKSGMFRDIKVKIFNKDIGDPFQIQIKHGTHYANIMDVGYGVSQLLPILVRMIMDKFNRKSGNNKHSKFFDLSASTRFLLQQPEIHLHPQAQAALGSLLVKFAEDGKGQNFLVETHSDYIMDRIRVEIREGNISPENVSLVYHEIKKGHVQLHNISFDKMGNLLNTPDGYGNFFIDEMNKVLGF